MDKKKLTILLSSLFALLLLVLGIFLITTKDNTANPTKSKGNVKTAQIKDGTSYNSSDTEGEYEKMLKEAVEQEKLEKLEKEKQKEQAKEKATSNENTPADSSKESSKENEVATTSNSTKIVKENGQEFIVDSHWGKMPVGAAGSGKPLKSEKANADQYKDIEPIYEKYSQESPKSTQNKKTKETNVLNKYFKSPNNLVVNSPVDVKGDSGAMAYKTNTQGKIVNSLVVVMNLKGTAKAEGVKNMNYIVNFDEDYMKSHLDTCFNIAKDLGLRTTKAEFKNTYKKYKLGKVDDNSYKNKFNIGYNGMAVTVEW